MDISSILVFLLIGAMTGSIAGLLGIGGGLIYVPALLYYLESQSIGGSYTHVIAVATSLSVICVSVISAVQMNYKNQNISVRSLPFLAMGSVIGTLISSRFLTSLDGKEFKIYLGIFQVLVALRMMTAKKSSGEGTGETKSKFRLTTVGTISGAISAFFGMGGGVITVPLLHLTAGFKLARAIGTSSGLIVFSTGLALTSYIQQGIGMEGMPSGNIGFINLPAFLAIAPTAFACNRIGAKFAKKFDGPKLKKIFSFFLLGVGTLTIARSFAHLF